MTRFSDLELSPSSSLLLYVSQIIATLFFKNIFFNFKTCVLVWVHEYKSKWPKEVTGPLGAGGISSCKPLQHVYRNWTPVLWMNSVSYYLLSHLANPKASALNVSLSLSFIKDKEILGQHSQTWLNIGNGLPGLHLRCEGMWPSDPTIQMPEQGMWSASQQWQVNTDAT